MKRTVFAVVVGVALALPAVCGARTDRELTYRESEIWQAAIRFLRVDSGFKILEKDKDAGYLLFEYKDSGAACNASFEMVRTARDNKVFVRARIQIESMPRYVEAVLFDRFLRKLRDEYGEPPPPQAVTPPPAPSPGAAPAAPKPGGSAADGEQDPEDKTEDELEPEDQEAQGDSDEVG